MELIADTSIKGCSVINSYKVPAKVWKGLNELERELFNSVYFSLKHSDEIYPNSSTSMIVKDDRLKIAWNAALIAAECLRTSKVDWYKTVRTGSI